MKVLVKSENSVWLAGWDSLAHPTKIVNWLIIEQPRMDFERLEEIREQTMQDEEL